MHHARRRERTRKKSQTHRNLRRITAESPAQALPKSVGRPVALYNLHIEPVSRSLRFSVRKEGEELRRVLRLRAHTLVSKPDLFGESVLISW
jgi:hypothetical protein